MVQMFKQHTAWLTGVPFALLYGAVARIIFGQNLPTDAFVVMSWAFLFLVPVAIGALTVWFTPGQRRTSWTNAFFLPWLSCGIGAAIAGLFFIEAFICVVMALPILFVMSSIGGLLMCLVLRRRGSQNQMMLLGVLLLTPYVAAPIESHFATREATATVETQVFITADSATVWANIIRVPMIHDEERSYSPVFDLFGAPKPLAATLDHAGIGGVRRGLFEKNLAFIETITVWEPERRIAWSIHADTSQVTEAPWPEIGGRYFEVAAASYRIEPVDGGVVLHLSSTHRLTTRFNGYGLLWTRWGLGEFQRQILQVIKGRAEKGGSI